MPGEPQLRRATPDGDASRRLLDDYGRLIVERAGGLWCGLDEQEDPDQYREPGAWLVLYDGDAAIGCGGLRALSEQVAEVKRMYVEAGARGRGLGRLLLTELERIAAEGGSSVVRLDTSSALHEAVALYRSAGYREVPPYNDNPHADLWFEKELVPPADAGA